MSSATTLRIGATLALAILAAVPGCAIFRPSEPPPAPLEVAAEDRPLPTTRFYLEGPNSNVVGQLQVIRTRQKDTFIDIAQSYHLGYDELVEANPGIDPWLPGEGTEVVLPSRFVLPDAPHQGIVLNVAAKRLFYFPKTLPGELPIVFTFPVSVGREGWATPLGKTRVVAKVRDPVWHVPASVRKEHADNGDPLPAVVPPGPDNPLGKFALRLAVSGDYLIHGTNKPAGVGMRISHGCIRMNPDDIAWLFPQVPVGLPVHLVNQPVMIGWREGELLVQAHPPLEEDKPPRAEWLRRQVESRARKNVPAAIRVDYERLTRVAAEQRGIPVSVVAGSADTAATVRAAPRVKNTVTYDWFSEGTGGKVPDTGTGSEPKTMKP
jgi:L,D-transpeptidase ErfK/SrfK